MLIKVMPAGGHEAMLMGQPVNALMKLASNGMRGNDLREFVKRAGHFVADAVRDIHPSPGECLVHSIALGAGEFYGPNRNGDYFSEDSCRKYHKTFEKYARAYRDHENKDPSKSYGVIKQALYNEPMHRIELIIAYNATKEAAARNGGLVADQEMDLLNSGKDFDTSMACKVPFDVCSGCGNRARTRADYCSGTDEGGHCKVGGLKNRITLVTKEGKQLYADNPDPLWFDNSKVWRHADRIAVASGILKSASAGKALGGAALAEALGVTAPWEVAADNESHWAVKLAAKLARLDDNYRRDNTTLAFVDRDNPDWLCHGCSIKEALSALASSRVMMPVRGFLELTSGSREKAAAAEASVKAALPGVYGRMISDGSISILPTESAYERLASRDARFWAAKLASDYSVTRDDVLRRVTRAGIYHERPPAAPAFEKVAASAEELARAYASYQLSFLRAVSADHDYGYMCAMAVQQNRA